MAAKAYGIGEELVLTMNRHTLQGVVANDMTAKENADKGATYHLPDLHGKRQGDAAFFLITLGTRLHTTERRSSHWQFMVNRTFLQLNAQQHELESRQLEWRSAGTGRCSYRVRRVDGSCAKYLTIEFYTVVMLLTFILISIPSPLTLSFQA